MDTTGVVVVQLYHIISGNPFLAPIAGTLIAALIALAGQGLH